jgi:hypothetical protein
MRAGKPDAATMLNRQLASVAVIGETLASGMIAGARADNAVPLTTPTACWQPYPTVAATDSGAMVSAVIVGAMCSTLIACAMANSPVAITDLTTRR